MDKKSSKTKEILEKVKEKTTFSWADFDMDKFFKETDKVGEILRKRESEIRTNAGYIPI